MPYQDLYEDQYDLDQRFKPFPTLPTVVWAIDDYEVPVSPDWVGTGDDRGGFDEALIRVRDTGRLPNDIREGPIKATEYGSGEVVWQGTVDGEPRMEGSMLEVRGTGDKSALVNKESDRLYFTPDTSSAKDAHEDPHNYTDTKHEHFEADARPQMLVFAIDDESYAVGDRHRLAIPFTDLVTRFTCGVRKPTSAPGVSDMSDFEIRIERATFSQGTPTLEETIDLGSGGPANIDTGVFSGENMLLAGLRCKSPRNPTARRVVRLTNPKFYGRATSDTMGASAIVVAFATEVGLSTSRVESFTDNVLPLYWQGGSWAELMDYLATITDRYWGVFDGGNLEFAPYSTEWTTSEASGAAVTRCDPLKPASSILVNYPDLSGESASYELTFSPNPNESEGINPQAVFELRDRQSNSTLAQDVATWNAEYLKSPGFELEALVTRCWKNGVPESPYRIRGGILSVSDCGPMGMASERIRGFRYTNQGTEVTCNVAIDIGEAIAEAADVRRRRKRHKKPRAPKPPRRPRF